MEPILQRIYFRDFKSIKSFGIFSAPSLEFEPICPKEAADLTGDVPKKKKVPPRQRKPKKDAEGRDIIVRKRPRKGSQLLSPTAISSTQPVVIQDPVQMETQLEQVRGRACVDQVQLSIKFIPFLFAYSLVLNIFELLVPYNYFINLI